MNWYWYLLGIENKGWKRIIILIHIIVLIIGGSLYGAYEYKSFSSRVNEIIELRDKMIDKYCNGKYYNNLDNKWVFVEVDENRCEWEKERWEEIWNNNGGLIWMSNSGFNWTIVYVLKCISLIMVFNFMIILLRRIYLWISRGFKES